MYVLAASNGIMNVSGWGILWTVLNLLILFILLRIFLFKPVLNMMDKRKKMVEDSLADAAKKQEEAEKLKAQYENALSSAKKEAGEIVATAQKEANDEHEKIVADARKEAQQMLSQASQTIEQEKKKSLEDAQSEIADIAMSAAEKLVGRSLDDEANRKLLDTFLQEEGASE